MRIKISGENNDIEIINVETGERIEGVTSVSMKLDPVRGHTLSIHVCDFDIDVTIEGSVEGVN